MKLFCFYFGVDLLNLFFCCYRHCLFVYVCEFFFKKGNQSDDYFQLWFLFVKKQNLALTHTHAQTEAIPPRAICV